MQRQIVGKRINWKNREENDSRLCLERLSKITTVLIEAGRRPG
jgi:hypothetical protein